MTYYQKADNAEFFRVFELVNLMLKLDACKLETFNRAMDHWSY